MTSVSLVIPILNEQEVLPELLRRVRSTLDGLGPGDHEVVFVNDGSSDRTAELLDAAARQDARIGALHLSRNFGHQLAITAGLDAARGDWVAVLDGDLQDPPEAVPEMLARARQGFDVVYARRVQRKENALLRLCYFGAYRLIAAFSSQSIPLDAGDFSVMSRQVVDTLRATREQHRFVRGLRAWAGFRQTAMDVERHARQAGAPKYSWRGLLRLALNGLFSFSIAPLRVAAGLGFLAVGLSLLYLFYALIVRWTGDTAPRGFTALVALFVFGFGVQLLCLGIIGEYIGRVYEQVKERPLYVVARKSGVGKPD